MALTAVVQKYRARESNKYVLEVIITCTANSGTSAFTATTIQSLIDTDKFPLEGLYGYSLGAYPGATAPTDATDVTLTMNGIDILGGNGTNLIDATSYTSCPFGSSTADFPVPITGDITVNISNNSVNDAIVYLVATFVAD